MNLPEDFQFSASSLQDFVDCPRRFYLRYIRQLRFPAPLSEPLRSFEVHVERGLRFHHLVHQHQVGIPARTLAASLSDDTLAAWWHSYIGDPPADLPPHRFPEITLTMPFAGRRLVARYDLLALDDRAVIVDWKTTLVRPTRETLERRLQTIVYPYVLAQAGAHLNGGTPFAPEAITLIYWFAEFPKQPEIFTYTAAQFERDGAYLQSLASDILRRTSTTSIADEFPLTDDLDRCALCAYRSLNGRGAQAGNALVSANDDLTDDFAVERTLDQIAEIGF